MYIVGNIAQNPNSNSYGALRPAKLSGRMSLANRRWLVTLARLR